MKVGDISIIRDECHFKSTQELRDKKKKYCDHLLNKSKNK